MQKLAKPLKRIYSQKSKVTVSIRMPEDLKRKLDELAEEYGRSFSDFVQDGLDQWAALHDENEKKTK